MSSGSRRFHQKSRNGCAQCKKRRIKCDGLGPVCSHCSKRGDSCSYLGSEYVKASFVSGQATRRPSMTTEMGLTSVFRVHRSLSQYTNFRAPLDQQVMHHFLTNTCFTVSFRQDPSTCEIWRTLIPQMAEKSLCVRESILAVSAIHLCLLGHPDSARYYAMACKYAVQSSGHFRESATQISRNNWQETTAFSITSAIFGLSVSLVSEQIDSSIRFAPLDMLRIMRSFGGMVGDIDTLIAGSDVWEKLAADSDPSSPSSHYVLKQTFSRLADIERCLHSTALRTETAQNVWTYLATIDALKQWATSVSGSPRVWREFITWPATVPPRYFDLVESGCPFAIEIFVQWCEIMKQAPARWFLLPWLGKTITYLEAMEGPDHSLCRVATHELPDGLHCQDQLVTVK